MAILMGLLELLKDPQFLAYMGAGLLQHDPRQKANFGNDLSRGLLGGMQGMAQAKSRGMQDEMQKLQLEQARRTAQQNTGIDALAAKAFAPGMAPQIPNDDEGNQMPMIGAGGGLPEFGRGLMGIDPIKGVAFQQSLAKDSPFNKVDPKDYTPDSLQRFSQTRNPSDLRPRDKVISEDLGGMRGYRTEYSTQPLGGAVKTASPDAMLTDARSRSEGGLNRGVTVRGQDLTDDRAREIAQDARAAKPLTETQAKGSLYLGMMRDAEGSIAKLKNFDPATAQNQTLIAFARGDIPKLPKFVQNSMAGGDAQKYTQGAYQWSEAMLRQLTGAAAPDTEVWRNAKTYFPMPGDSKEVIAQKNQQRKQISDYVEIIAGRGAAQVDDAQANRKEKDPLGIR